MRVVISLALVPVLVQLLGGRPAVAFPNEPRGFGEVRLGMSVEQVRKILPHMKAASTADPGSVPLVAFYSIGGQTLYGLKPCDVGLRFDPEKLYEITFDCGRSAKIVDVLEKEFGEPAVASPRGAFWMGERTVVTLNPKARTFAFVDHTLNQAVRARILQYTMQHPPNAGAAATPGAPPPPETPQ